MPYQFNKEIKFIIVNDLAEKITNHQYLKINMNFYHFDKLYHVDNHPNLKV